MSSPLRSPARTAEAAETGETAVEHQIPPPPLDCAPPRPPTPGPIEDPIATSPPQSPLRLVALAKKPPCTPTLEATVLTSEAAEAGETAVEHQIPPLRPDRIPPRPPSPEPIEDPIAASPPQSLLRLLELEENPPHSPTLEPIDEPVAAFLLRSPLRLPDLAEIPAQSPPTNALAKPDSPAAPMPLGDPAAEVVYSAVTIANRLTRDDGVVLAAAALVGGGYGSGAKNGKKGLRAVPAAVRRAELRKAALGLRVSAAVLCLVSFSVMVSDKTQGWAGDTFQRYQEFRYSLGVNLIAFAYSWFQVYTEVHHMITGRRFIRRPWAHCFDLALDQILAYLLMSSSSAAASRNDVWVSRFNADDFTEKVYVSVAVSFLAFIAIALSAVLSAYNTFSSLS